MSNYDPLTSDLSLIPIETLRQWQIDALTALHKLSIGTNGQSYTYSQGDGTRTVTYNASNINDLRAWLAKLNAQLGIGRRGPMRVVF